MDYEIIAIHYERTQYGISTVTVLLSDGRELEAIRDAEELGSGTAYVSEIKDWPLKGENSSHRGGLLREEIRCHS